MLDIASRRRDEFLYNIYQMGKNQIDQGSHDSWTTTPSKLDSVTAMMARDRAAAGGAAGGGRGGRGGGGAAAGGDKFYTDFLHAPERRDPRGYIIPADQPDFLTATKFVNMLRTSTSRSSARRQRSR